MVPKVLAVSVNHEAINIKTFSNSGNENVKYHCVKSVRIWSFSGPYLPAFGLNTEFGLSLDKVSHRIQSECGKIRTKKTPNTDTFHAVLMTSDTFFERLWFCWIFGNGEYKKIQAGYSKNQLLFYEEVKRKVLKKRKVSYHCGLFLCILDISENSGFLEFSGNIYIYIERDHCHDMD